MEQAATPPLPVVVVLDDLSTGHPEAARGRDFVKGDIADVSFTKKLLQEKAIEAVVHFAASSLVGESMADPLKYYRRNVGGTVALVQAMREDGVAYTVTEQVTGPSLAELVRSHTDLAIGTRAAPATIAAVAPKVSHKPTSATASGDTSRISSVPRSFSREREIADISADTSVSTSAMPSNR